MKQLEDCDDDDEVDQDSDTDSNESAIHKSKIMRKSKVGTRTTLMT